MIELKETFYDKTCSNFSYKCESKREESKVRKLKYCREKTLACYTEDVSDLLERLREISEVKVTTFEGIQKNLSRVSTQVLEYKTTPFEYQKEGIQYGLRHNCWMLLDAPGLGKTLQMIYLAEELKQRDKIEHCLVICGLNTLKSNWKKQILLHSNESCKILGERVNRKGKVVFGGIPDRIAQLKQKIEEFFVIVNIETIRDQNVVKLINKGINHFDMIVFDEAHVAKSSQSIQGKNMLKLNQAKYRIAMTGTLILNDPVDCFMPLKWIGKDNSTLTNFKVQYHEKCFLDGKETIRYKHIDAVKDQLAACSLRRTKNLLKLPPKNIIDEYLDMNEDQKKFYDNIVDGIVSQCDKVVIRTTQLLALVARLRQATACPSVLTSENISSVKQDRCVSLVNEIISNDSKVVVFSTFKETLNVLAKKLQQYNPLVCTGDVSDEIISSNIDKFQSDDEHKVLLATHQKMGTGITLTAASYAIFIDTPFTSGVYEQACDRIHRIGSTDPVFIYNLICNDTFDVRVRELLSIKSAISDFVVDDIINEKTESLLRRYIKELVSSS